MTYAMYDAVSALAGICVFIQLLCSGLAAVAVWKDRGELEEYDGSKLTFALVMFLLMAMAVPVIIRAGYIHMEECTKWRKE